MALKWRGDELKRRLRRKVKAQVEHATEVLAQAVREEAPVRTGRLRDSVEERPPETDGAVIEGTVAITAPYARYVIRGTRKTKANPFPRRAIVKVKGRIRSILEGRGDAGAED